MTPASPASSVGPTNLAWLHQETLTSIVRLRSGRQQVADANYFRNQIREALRAARDQALNQGYSEQAIKDTQRALVALLDSTIAELGSPMFAEWSRRPLAEPAQTEGDGFFQSLERLMAQPDSIPLADTLEVYLLCLLLGHGGGRTSLEPDGSPPLRDSVMERLFRMRGYTGDLSPAWRPPDDEVAGGTAVPGAKRLLIVVLGGLLALGLVFGAYKITIGKSVAELRTLTGASITGPGGGQQ